VLETSGDIYGGDQTMDVKVLFTTSRDIHAKHGVLNIGKYSIEPIPCNSSNLIASKIKCLLRFQDEISEDERRSNPIREAELFLSFYALSTRSRLDIDSLMINSVKIKTPNFIDVDIYKEYEEIIEGISDFELHFNNLKNFNYKIARQFLRGCEVYRTAINLIGLNNTLSFFLLCIAIECVSNKVSNGSGTFEKFSGFILSYLPDKTDFETDADWKKILQEIYYNHRSGFTHGGKSIPEATYIADRFNRKYVRNIINGKEVRTPSLKWFERIVHDTLIGYLSKVEQKEERDQIDFFKEISLESGILNFVPKKKIIKAGQIVTNNDVKLD
jgi:hypothetical protein